MIALSLALSPVAPVAGSAADANLAGAGYYCDFTQACIDKHPCFASYLGVVIVPGHRADLVELRYTNGRRRVARVVQDGDWLSFTTDVDLNRVEVLQTGPKGEAVLVASQSDAPPYTDSRTGQCLAIQKDPT